MADILNNDSIPYSNTTTQTADISGDSNKETPSKENFLDKVFKYAGEAVGLYKEATTDKPIGHAPAYSVQLGKPKEKKVLGMSPITGYIVIITVIGLIGYAIYAAKKKEEK